jgi:prepilin-type N-terminal cleavage/methylation domain-containing protein
VRKGFTLLELLVVLAFLAILAALSFPAWRVLLDSGSRRTSEALVMDALEHARSEAISSGREVWLVLRHHGGNGRDALRILTRTSDGIAPMGGWSPLPPGIVFQTGSSAIPDAHPPKDIQDAADTSPGTNATYGAIMFLRSGTVGWPKPGEGKLCIPLDSKKGSRLITLSRGTGRATISSVPGGGQ